MSHVSLLITLFFKSSVVMPLRGFPESVIPYLVEDYQKDIAGYNVTQCVHIQALMPDPVEETR